MSYQFDATSDFFNFLPKIDTLVSFAKNEGKAGNEDNRKLFLKLCLTYLVTRFQVYVESVLKDLHYKLKTSGSKFDTLPLHLKLHIAKLYAENNQIHKKLEDPTRYSNDKKNEVIGIISYLNKIFDNYSFIENTLEFTIKYPIGKQGSGEIKKLFSQFEGKNIFTNTNYDSSKLDEILNKRHNIIHNDANPFITENTIKEYKNYIIKLVKRIDRYLSRFI